MNNSKASSDRSIQLPSPRELAHEIARRIAERAGSMKPAEGPIYVVRISNPITALERLQLAAARLARQPIAVVPHPCATMEEWLARYGRR